MDASAKSRSTYCLLVGPLPPPVHGASSVRREIANKIEDLPGIRCIDVAPKQSGKTAAYFLSRLGRYLKALGALCAGIGRSQRVMYLSLSGGMGLLFDSVLVGIASTLRYRLFLHHHSFAYLNRPTRLMTFISNRS